MFVDFIVDMTPIKYTVRKQLIELKRKSLFFKIATFQMYYYKCNSFIWHVRNV